MKEVLFMWTIGLILTAIVTGIVYGPGYLRYRKEQRLLVEGLPATATIISLDDTGNRFNDMPEIIVHLEVRAEGMESWKAVFHRTMGVPDVQFFTPGRVIPVKYDPKAPDYVVYAP